MDQLIDTCVWVDHLRKTTSANVRMLATEIVNRVEAVLCEPVAFELLRDSLPTQRAGIEKRLSTLPMLATPATLWREATQLGQRCRDCGVQASSQDLLIVAVCLHHSAILVTFDQHFAHLAKITGLKAEIVARD